jgi:hypothetical protein
MKYTKFVFLAIFFFLCSLGVNLYFYYTELLEKARETDDKINKEGFIPNQSGILTQNDGTLMTCSIEQINQKISIYTTNGQSIGKCMDLSYVDDTGALQSNKRMVIYENYYVDQTTGMLNPVPYGYKANPEQTGYYANTKNALFETSNNSIPSPLMRQTIDPNTIYDISSSVQYNTGYVPTTDNTGDLPPGKMNFPNGDGTNSVVDIDLYDQSKQYYETGTYVAGPRNFMPNYEPTGFLSTLGSQNIQDLSNKDPIYLAGAPLANTETAYTDIGTLYANDLAKLEAACNAMDPLFCASSNSCVLLGGQKCVSGNENGPKMKSNYSDYMIINRDYYYFKGKCYGMCLD